MTGKRKQILSFKYREVRFTLKNGTRTNESSMKGDSGKKSVVYKTSFSTLKDEEKEIKYHGTLDRGKSCKRESLSIH